MIKKVLTNKKVCDVPVLTVAIASVFTLMGVMSHGIASADDTVLIQKQKPLVAPNALFVMDVSGSMGDRLDGNGNPLPNNNRRLDVLRNALTALMADQQMKDINIGLMTFTGVVDTHGVAYPVTPIDGSAQLALDASPPFVHPSNSYLPATGGKSTRDYLTSVSSTWAPGSGTPIVDALYEAALYFKGKPVFWGDLPASDRRSSHPSTYSVVGGQKTYKTPITKECQNNAIILLSDGEPTINNGSNNVASLIGNYANACNVGSFDGRCGPELAAYLSNTDHQPNLDGEHRIKTYTVGFALATGSPARTYMDSIAKAGGTDKAYFANSQAGLVASLRDALNSTKQNTQSFSSPTYSVDPNSLLSHGNEVFIPVFEAGSSSVWSGNLKKFTLVNGQLVDKNNQPATDKSGNFEKDVKDEWSQNLSATEHPVNDGGVAKLLDPDQRKIYSDLGALTSSYPLLKAKLGDASMSNTRRKQLLNFIKGKRLDGSKRYHIGDIIHSKPAMVSYGTNSSVVFVGTNEGFLHAFDTRSGKEKFAFMPDELLKNIAPQFKTVESANPAKTDHLYGVDGEITVWHDDKNQNNQVDGSEKVILYFGLRRGGHYYYALDVTQPASPKLLWKKKSNAHSWTKPVIANLKYKPNPKAKPVVIVGGGYSDDAAGNEIVGKGNAVYILDALSGAEVWHASSAQGITHAVASQISVLDVDQNNSVDRLYFSTTGGNIWRVDLNASNLDGSGDLYNINKAKVSKLASLGSQHKFFVEPDVAIFKYKGQFVLSVSIGSGERPNPLDTTNNDAFFVIFDENVYQLPPANPSTTDITQLVTAPANNIDLISKNRSYHGWKMPLSNTGIKGEKVLSAALTFKNKVMFTSFGLGNTTLTPKDCSQKTADLSTLYVLDLLTGDTALDLDGDGVINTTKDKSITIGSGIIGTPQVVFPKANCTTPNCQRPYEIRVGNASVAVFNNQTLSNQKNNNDVHRVYWLDQNK